MLHYIWRESGVQKEQNENRHVLEVKEQTHSLIQAQEHFSPISFDSSAIKDVPDSCLHDNGRCEHFCVEEDGQRNCSCVDGYFLGADGQNCLTSGEKITKHNG